ncbi:MAG: Asp-tRNA(Asn)/Glu-tRNA(Gln) amidotransferase subunit GatB [Spirochaetes bacterium]|nr:Asp-tRNA(Asn)/Glu-tRNA(Gln) amidotransferase subunit GatB [Spirochaetota bacterium]
MYQSFIGLEIHIQLLTQSKVFCSCPVRFGDEPNTNVCPICMGYPGVLPSLNREAVKYGYVVARALNCQLSPVTVFERKNYFYPDMPKNYQISQYTQPIGRNGYMDIEFRKKKKRVRIHEVHLEEDAGKSIHAGDLSLLDYNRAGTPLLEIVTEPDLEIGEEAEVLLQNFRRMVRYLGVCDGNMEEGSLRCDANVSVNLRGQGLGKKVEIKNLNSSRFVRLALNYEIARQEEILSRGGTILQETRLWNENRDITEGMRTKESAHDYRYFPEPDLPPFKADHAFLEEVEACLVELPDQRKNRFLTQYNLSETLAEFLTAEKSTADFFERAVELGADPVGAATWLSSDVQKLLNRQGLTLLESPLNPERFAELMVLLQEGKIHGKLGKQVLELVFQEGKSPKEILKDRNWEQITDPSVIGPIVEKILTKNPHVVETIRRGDLKPWGFLVGLIMKETSGRADPRVVHEILKERLQVSFIYLLTFGGAISGRRDPDGMVVPGGSAAIRKILEQNPSWKDVVRVEELPGEDILSEEITPADWATLILRTATLLQEGNAKGIVITHGTDTLSYTASLFYWLFGNAEIPIVFTAASLPPEEGSEAAQNILQALQQSEKGEKGVSVVFGGETYKPVNLRFLSLDPMRFYNWNAERIRNESPSPFPLFGGGLGVETLRERIEGIVRKIFIVKVFPGLQGDQLICLINAGVRFFILELFDTGTANLRESPFSLKKAFEIGKTQGVRFFCTSQQEGVVDFSGYVTAHALWKEGAIPMGALATESVYTKLIAAFLYAESEEEILQWMEENGASIG